MSWPRTNINKAGARLFRTFGSAACFPLLSSPGKMTSTQNSTPSRPATAHSWVRRLTGGPPPSHAAAVRFAVVALDTERLEQKVFESVRCRLREDLDGVDALRRVAADVSAGVQARAERLQRELARLDEEEGDEERGEGEGEGVNGDGSVDS